jgi:hypothetical protein
MTVPGVEILMEETVVNIAEKVMNIAEKVVNIVKKDIMVVFGYRDEASLEG